MEIVSENTPEKPQNRLLDTVNTPDDFRHFDDMQLRQLADEVRAEMVDVVSRTGGHLGAGLGVVELSVAIHAVFETPDDRLIWDVGHQAYPHKIITGRKDRMDTIRQGGGLSGFTKRSESEYDPFGAGHSSTSISAGLGMAVGQALQAQRDRHVIAVIGDGAMSAGMAYEAMNNAGALNQKMIVILNDNEMSIAPPVGALSNYLTKLVSSKPYVSARDIAKSISKRLPDPVHKAAKRAEELARGFLNHDSTFFESLGFYYIGPVDGHDMDQLLNILRNVKTSDAERPILIHAITQKGKGYAPAEHAKDKMHGVSKFDIVSGQSQATRKNAPSYTEVFAHSLINEAARDEKIVAINAAMPSGTGLDKFDLAYPDRCFDVGIAEQHAVTFAAGLACEGMKPFCAIYSTFLQRAYDQIVHDVAIQNLPVRFMIDRAGLVGADGQTHAGSFDIAYLGCLPNFVLMAASDEVELRHMVTTAAAYDDGPIALRYPRGNGQGLELPEQGNVLPIGKGRIIQKGKDIAILSSGGRLAACKQAIKDSNANITLADARFAKPLDLNLIKDLAKKHHTIITIEEGSSGGFGSMVMAAMNDMDLLQKTRLTTMHLPDTFQAQDSPEPQYESAGLGVKSVTKAIKDALKK